MVEEVKIEVNISQNENFWRHPSEYFGSFFLRLYFEKRLQHLHTIIMY